MGLAVSLLLCLAIAVFAVGLAARVWRYSRIPAPLKIPTMPAPVSKGGVALRLLREMVFFESLFKATRWTWLFAWMFHAGLVVVVLAHLRYFTQPVWSWVTWISPYSTHAAVMMMVGLAGLLLRRLIVARVRYISTPSDYLMLLLLLLLAASGLLMRYIFYTDILAVREFVISLFQLRFSSLPGDFMLILHVSLVSLLLLVFPFSKLLHAPGLFFSPSRNQVDNSRQKRHVNPWSDVASNNRKSGS